MRDFRAFACCSTVDLPAPTFLRTLTVVRSIPIPNANRYATFRGHFDASLYFNSQQSVCIQIQAVRKQCDADKECSTYSSLANGTCDESTDTPTQAKKWVYVVVAVCILGGMVGTLVALYSIRRTAMLSPRSSSSIGTGRYAAPSACS